MSEPAIKIEPCAVPGCDTLTSRGICDSCDHWVDEQVEALDVTSALPPPAADVAVLDEDGRLWLPGEGDAELGWHLHNGARLRWLPLDVPDRVIVQFLGSKHRTDEDRKAFEEEGFVAGFMRDDLRHLIGQLQAIDAMLEDR